VLLVDEDLDNKASKWFAVDTESDDLPVEIKGRCGLKCRLEVHTDALPEKFCEVYFDGNKGRLGLKIQA
jgi:hypothetical protein